MLDKKLAVVSFDSSPLSFESPIGSPYAVYKELTNKGEENYITDPADLLRESSYYPLLSKHLITGVSAEQRQPNTSDKRTFMYLYPHAQANSRTMSLPEASEPEMFATVPHGTRKCPQTGELKSLGDKAVMFSEVFVSSLGALIESFFPNEKVEARFYDAPPLCFAIVGAGYMAHVVVVEWVGQLRLTPISNPFFLGSPEHAGAIESINKLLETPEFEQRYATPLDVPFEGWRNIVEGRIAYRDHGKEFMKVLQGWRDARGEYYKQVYNSYMKYQALTSTARDLPSALVPAKLLFGQFKLLVRMQAVGDRDVTDDELRDDPSVMGPISDAIVYLAKHGLLYSDLRSPNVRRSNDTGAVYLVDYDDLYTIDECSTFIAFTSAALEIPNNRVTYLGFAEIMTSIEEAYQR